MTRSIVPCLILSLGIARAADSLNLTLPEAVRMALAQNRTLKIARLRVQETERKRDGSRSSYFPEIRNQSVVGHTTAEENVGIPAGAFGITGAGPVPTREVLIDQGHQSFVTSGTTISQPLTPLIRIRQANRIASSAVAISRDELQRAEIEVAVKVHEIYYGILTSRLQKQAVQQEEAYSRARLRESAEDVRNGSALKIAVIEGQAALLQSEQDLLSMDLRLDDLNTELNDLLGLPLGTRLELSPAPQAELVEPARDESLQTALSANPQIAAAQETVQQARAALTAAKSTYIPDVSVFARHSYQNGVPFLVHNFGTFGVALNYDVFDFGKRRAAIRERESQLAQAEQNLERLKEAVNVQVERSLNKVERTRHMLQVASAVVELRTEGDRVASNQFTNGVILVSARRQASAATYKAQADFLQAQLAHLLARAELDQAIGRTPGF